MNTTIWNAAKLAGCEQEVQAIEEVIHTLQASRLKCIAVLGETNCGKTSLINVLAGQEARKPTRISMGEEPLMVVFNSEETRQGFEIANIQQGRCEGMDVAFFEIPINMALDYESGKPLPILEMMDAVIYVTSALMPFTASDAAHLEAIANRFPLMIYISKLDMMDSDEDRNTSITYTQNQCAQRFGGTICQFFHGNAGDEILETVRAISLEELREFHILQLEQIAKTIVADRLDQARRGLAETRKKREEEQARIDEDFRSQKLIWEDLRLSMIEKQQETVDAADKKVSMAKIAAKDNVNRAVGEAQNKAQWINECLKPMLQNEIAMASSTAVSAAMDMASAHAAWLVSEVNRRFDKQIEIKRMSSPEAGNQSVPVSSNLQTPGYEKILIAVGAGAVAGGVILSSIPLIPTCVVAIPAALIAAAFVKGSIDERNRYASALSTFAESSCEKNFNALSKDLHSWIDRYYSGMVENIRALSETGGPKVDFSDILEREREIDGQLDKLNMED